MLSTLLVHVGLLFSPKLPGSLTLVQSGQTSWADAGRIEGWADPDLSPEGVEEVGEAAQALLKMGYSFDVAYTSMLTRAVRTTWIILQELDISYVPVSRLWRLNERCAGALTGLTEAEARETYGEESVPWLLGTEAPPPFEGKAPYNPSADRRYKAWQEPRAPWRLRQVPCPNAEDYEAVRKRVEPVWDELLLNDLADGKSVLVVAHSDTLRAIMADVCDVDVSCMVEPEATAPLHFRFERQKGGKLLPIAPASVQLKGAIGEQACRSSGWCPGG